MNTSSQHAHVVQCARLSAPYRVIRLVALCSLVIVCTLSIVPATKAVQHQPAKQRQPIKQQRAFLWFDAEANFERLNTPDSIRFYFDKAKECGFTDLVIDVKPITGEVLYKSRLQTNAPPQMTEWKGVRRDSVWRGKPWDFVQTCIDEAHKRSLKAHLSLNVFVAGHNFFNRGVMYSDSSKLAWQSVNYTDSGLKPITTLKHKYSAMTNPVNPDVQAYELSILEETVRRYKRADGVILDRVRFDGIQADFSDVSRKAFERYIGRSLVRYPEDIYAWKMFNGAAEHVRGKYFCEWVEWRASVIYGFFAKARALVKSLNPSLQFATYTGAWYPTYFEVGANWASKLYDPWQDREHQYFWASPKYKNFGYAELLDFSMVGCYFVEVSKQEVEAQNEAAFRASQSTHNEPAQRSTTRTVVPKKQSWYSVEGSAELALKVTKRFDRPNAAPVYGSLYVEQYGSNADQFSRAVQMCRAKTDGVMIFDVIHIVQKNWWQPLKQALRERVH